jgi:beta-glucanase (GH16 family)
MLPLFLWALTDMLQQFKDDSSEIDIEVLSRQYSGKNSLGNFVIHSKESEENNFNAALTPTFDNQPLGFDPTTDFHEYRFDWTPESITFFIDGTPINNMTQSIPKGPGNLFINHWSNGSPEWTYGPPAQDAAMTVLYMKAYFNSSEANVTAQAEQRCKAAASTTNSGKTCKIPSQVKSQPTTTLGPPPSYTTGMAESVATASGTYTIAAGSTGLPSPGNVSFLSGNASNVVDEELYSNTYTGPGASTSQAGWSMIAVKMKFAAIISIILGLGMVVF